jgi:putative ABC transport system permease protein
MNSLLADVRLALRVWRKSPVFTAIAILSIALGIGANTAIFTLVDQVLLRRLPVANPEELVQVTFTGTRDGSNW